METLRDRIKRHEGLRLTPYQDTVGVLSVGFGHNMNYPISQEAADLIFEDDFTWAVNQFDKLRPWILPSIGEERIGVLIEMIFQLGVSGVLGFKKMLMATSVGDYEWAANEIMDSKAARQCPARFQEYAELMRNG